MSVRIPTGPSLRRGSGSTTGTRRAAWSSPSGSASPADRPVRLSSRYLGSDKNRPDPNDSGQQGSPHATGKIVREGIWRTRGRSGWRIPNLAYFQRPSCRRSATTFSRLASSRYQPATRLSIAPVRGQRSTRPSCWTSSSSDQQLSEVRTPSR